MKKKYSQSLLSIILVVFIAFLPTWAWAKSSQDVADTLSTSPSNVPKAAWLIEGTGAVLMGIGFISITAGYSFIGRRDQLIKDAERGGDSPATEVRETEDTGMTLLTVGWIVGGVGVTAMLVGAAWIIFHSPPEETTATKVASKKVLIPSPLPPSKTAQVLFKSDL